MSPRYHYGAGISAAIAAAILMIACSESPPRPEVAVNPSGDAARPADPTANLPSDSGSHTTLPSGAVTGAGQPQGTGMQPDVGAPGGLERRARAVARVVGETTPAATGATSAEPATGAGTSAEPASRPPRQSRG